MPNTAHSHVCAATVIEGIPIIRWVNPAAASHPGAFHYLTAAATATAYDTSTTVCNYIKPTPLEFKPRVDTTMARKDCDNDFGTSDIVPMILGGKKGPLQIVGYIEDPGATKYPMHSFMGSDTAECIEIAAKEATGATSGNAMLRPVFPIFNIDTIVSTDRFAKLLYY